MTSIGIGEARVWVVSANKGVQQYFFVDHDHSALVKRNVASLCRVTTPGIKTVMFVIDKNWIML